VRKYLIYSLLLLSLVMYEYFIDLLLMVKRAFTVNKETVTFGIIIVLGVFSFFSERHANKKWMEERDGSRD